MKIANEFTVSAPIEDAWNVLTNLEQVIPLMPGATMTGREGDDVLPLLLDQLDDHGDRDPREAGQEERSQE